jgi:hypothetical protein
MMMYHEIVNKYGISHIIICMYNMMQTYHVGKNATDRGAKMKLVMALEHTNCIAFIQSK